MTKEQFSKREVILLGKFKKEYVETNLVTILNEKAFAEACVEAFEKIRDNPTYEEFEEYMNAYPYEVRT